MSSAIRKIERSMSQFTRGTRTFGSWGRKRTKTHVMVLLKQHFKEVADNGK